MGKVASSSIYHSLQQVSHACYPFHVHVLSPEKIRARYEANTNHLLKPNRKNIRSKDLYELIIQPRLPAKIITLVRDPFARNVSAFFENSNLVRQQLKAKSPSVDMLIECFFEETNHTQAEHWFKNEFNRALELNVYSHPYSQETGWARFQSKPYDILILDTALHDSEKAKQIREFLELSDFRLTQHNMTSDGSRNELYKRFKSTIRFPKLLANEILNTDYSKHFFSEAMQNQMRDRWQKK
jgi:hypothetical protein